MFGTYQGRYAWPMAAAAETTFRIGNLEIGIPLLILPRKIDDLLLGWVSIGTAPECAGYK